MKQLLSYLQQELPGGLQLLEQMVNMESPSTDKALVDRFARFIGSQFDAIGGTVDYVPAERFTDHLRINFLGRIRIEYFAGPHRYCVSSPAKSQNVRSGIRMAEQPVRAVST
jgi:hypothetical protein